MSILPLLHTQMPARKMLNKRQLVLNPNRGCQPTGMWAKKNLYQCRSMAWQTLYVTTLWKDFFCR